MENHSSPEILLTHLDWNLHRLKDVLKQEKSEYFRDAALQRFGFTCDLAIKCIRAFAAKQGKQCEETPLHCFKLAARELWMDHNSDWKEMVDSYNRMSSAPLSEEADRIFSRLDAYHVLFNNLYQNLSKLD
jgi:hypothetical protein